MVQSQFFSDHTVAAEIKSHCKDEFVAFVASPSESTLFSYFIAGDNL